MRNAGLDEAQAGIKITGRNINNLRYADDTTLMAESEEELKSLLMKVKESEKVGLKLNIQKTKIMTSSLITSWQIDGESVADFILWGSKITADGDCSHEIKTFTPWEKKVPPKGNQSWIFIGRTDVEAETPKFWPDVKRWFIWKDPDAGKDWRREEKGTIEDEMVGWHHWLNGHEFE